MQIILANVVGSMMTQAATNDNGNIVNRGPWYETRSAGLSWFNKPSEPKYNAIDPTGYRAPSDWYGTLERISVDVTLTGTSMVPWGPWAPGVYSQTEYKGNTVAQFSVADFGDWRVQLLQEANKNALRTKILGNVKDEIFDAAMVIAELQGSVNTVATGLYRIGRSMLAIAQRKPEAYHYLMHGRTRDNRRPTDKVLREAASTYLEWKYGVMPVVMDVQGACKALDINENGGLFSNPPLLVSRAEIRDEGEISSPGYFEVMGLKRDQNFTIRTRSTCKARLDYEIDAEGVRGLNRYGLGLGSVATLAFEMTPFSFVLNMGFPIAELIKAWTALQGCNVKGYTETYHCEYTVLAGGAPANTSDGLPHHVWQQTGPYQSFIRSGSVTVPMPMPYVRNPIKSGNLATVLALFTQLRKA